MKGFYSKGRFSLSLTLLPSYFHWDYKMTSCRSSRRSEFFIVLRAKNKIRLAVISEVGVISYL